MTARQFATDAGKARIALAVERAERHTSAEIVVAIRRHASSYRRTSFAFGLAGTLFAFAVWWLSPTPYDARYLPLELAVAFGLAFYLIASVDPLRRVLTPAATRRRAMAEAAREAFTTLSVNATRERTGMLVYVGLFERAVTVVPDDGIALGSDDASGLARMFEASVGSRDVEAFAAAIEALGERLGKNNPRREDDENELCDAPR